MTNIFLRFCLPKNNPYNRETTHTMPLLQDLIRNNPHNGETTIKDRHIPCHGKNNPHNGETALKNINLSTLIFQFNQILITFHKYYGFILLAFALHDSHQSATISFFTTNALF